MGVQRYATILYFQIKSCIWNSFFTFVSMNFIVEFIEFLDNLQIDFTVEGSSFFCPKSNICFELIDINNFMESSVAKPDSKLSKNSKKITIYEDLWKTRNEVIKNRIKALVNPGKSLFARNCSVKKITTETASAFLNKNHILGNTSAKYKYGLYEKDILVAVATFSKSRPMNRGGVVLNSFEWVRYASCESLRVAGGMGKLLSFFEQDVNPDEIMTYADKDWSAGDSYKKLGFVLVSESEPIHFYINKITFERITIAKGDKFNESIVSDKDWIILSNNGNLKFLRSRIDI